MSFKYHLFIMIFFFSLITWNGPVSMHNLQGIEGGGAETKESIPGKVIRKGEGISEEIKKDKKLKLTVERVVEYLLKNNLDVKKVLLDYKGASSELLDYKSKYDIHVIANGAYSINDNPNKVLAPYYGKTTTTGNAGVGLQKQFDTGTTVTTSYTGIYQKFDGLSNRSPLFLSNEGYQSGIRIEVKQELLKNFMGQSDRLTEKKLANSEKMNRQVAKFRLAGLLVDAVIGYWNVAIAEMNLETGKKHLDSTIGIRDLIQRNLNLGLSEREEILDWDGRVMVSRNNFERAGKFLFDARLGVYRILDLDSGLDIEIGRTFRTTPPDVEYTRAVKDAFLKRIDWGNQQTMVKNAELEYRITYSDLLPSLRLKLSAGNQDYDPLYSKTFNSVNRDYSAGFEMTYPLENTRAEVKLRNARLNYMKASVDMKSMEKSIIDEIASLVKECEISFRIYEQTRKSREYAQEYYYQVYNKFRRGRYSAVQLKLAQDSFISSEQEELKNLINYNISLLKRDFARNVIFENLGIDIDGILKRADN